MEFKAHSKRVVLVSSTNEQFILSCQSMSTTRHDVTSNQSQLHPPRHDVHVTSVLIHFQTASSLLLLSTFRISFQFEHLSFAAARFDSIVHISTKMSTAQEVRLVVKVIRSFHVLLQTVYPVFRSDASPRRGSR